MLNYLSFIAVSTHLHIAQPLGSIIYQQLFDQIFRNGIHVSLPFDFAAQYFFINPKRLFIIEGGIANKHFVYKHT